MNMKLMAVKSSSATLRTSSVTSTETYVVPSPSPDRPYIMENTSDSPESQMKDYVLRLWAEDWDSDEDSIYDSL